MTDPREKLMAAMERAVKEGRLAWDERQNKFACPYPVVDDGTKYKDGLLRACWMHGWDHAAEDLAEGENYLAAKAHGRSAEARYLAKQSLGDLWVACCQLPYGWSLTRMRLVIAYVRFRVAYRVWRGAD